MGGEQVLALVPAPARPGEPEGVDEGHRRVDRAGDGPAEVGGGDLHRDGLGEVGGRVAEHRIGVGGAGVVGAQRLAGLRRHREVAGGPRAEHRGGDRDGVVEVLWIRHPVAVAVGAVPRPRRRDDLHRADRPVPHRVPVQRAAVGVGDGRHARSAVEGDAEDGWADHPVGAGGASTDPAVVALDLADASQQRPRDRAPVRAIGGGDGEVGRHCHRGDVGVAQAPARRRRWGGGQGQGRQQHAQEQGPHGEEDPHPGGPTEAAAPGAGSP